jgi:glyoxylase-like metal-dependent hydrolase (beta-lactamase superfamily II)
MRLARLALLCSLAAGPAHCARDRGPVASAPHAPAPHASDVEMRLVGEGLYALYYAGSSGKSIVVEGDDALALIEVPVSDEGGGARRLTEHREGGEQVLRTLRRAFPNKPLTYLLTTHWHPHSASSLSPFVEQGVKVVTTRANFERLKAMLGSALLARAADWVQFVDGDSFEVGRGRGRVVAHRFERSSYPSTPTDDYLYFYLPDHDALHVGCMYNKWDGPPVTGRELLTRREVDLHQFLLDRGLHPSRLIRVTREASEPSETLPAAGLERVVREGVRVSELSARYERLGAAEVRARRVALVREAAAEGIPAGVLNQLVYDDLRRRDLERALEFATLQALLAPGDPNAWDTLGQVHYFLGDLAMAKVYEGAARRVDPKFVEGGEPAWRADLEAHRRAWAASPPVKPAAP